MKMNKICKEYISEIKALFPIKQKHEREYINKLKSDVEDFYEEAKVTSKKELYDKYGKPNDVVNNYLSTINTEYITKRINFSRYIKIFIAVIILLATIATAAFCGLLYHQHLMDKQQEIIGVSYSIQ